MISEKNAYFVANFEIHKSIIFNFFKRFFKIEIVVVAIEIVVFVVYQNIITSKTIVINFVTKLIMLIKIIMYNKLSIV